MAAVERQATIAGSPDAVWSVLSDFGAISGWAGNVDHSCLLSEQGHDVGAVRRIQSGRTTVVESVERWEPGVALAYSITGLPPVIRSVTNTWLLTPDDPSLPTSTTVTLVTEIDTGPRPAQRAIAKVVGRKLAQASVQMLDGLAARMRATQETTT